MLATLTLPTLVVLCHAPGAAGADDASDAAARAGSAVTAEDAWRVGGPFPPYFRHYEMHNLSAVDPSAVCLDGSPGVFFFKRGAVRLKSTSRNWVLAFEGGGWCYTEEDCRKRSELQVGSSTQAVASFPGVQNPDCAKNDEFCEWNQVSFHYCDGNSFNGDRDEPVRVGDKELFFRGHRILRAALRLLIEELGLRTAEEVLLTGCSAGGQR
eukprot:2904592-Prymnesium_polylepis.1